MATTLGRSHGQSRLCPPGPRGSLRVTMGMARDIIRYAGNLFDRYGDVVSVSFAFTPAVMTRHPHHVKHILQDNHANYRKDSAFTDKVAGAFIGRGLLNVSDPAIWRRNRRLVQPAFHRRQVEGFAELMRTATEELADDWEREFRAGRPVDVNASMSELTLTIIARSVLGLDLDAQIVKRFTHAVRTCNEVLGDYAQFPLVPLSFPTPAHRRYWRSIAVLNEVVHQVINDHGTGSGNRDGLISVLIDARDEETGERLSDREVRDEVMTLFFAGHETSARTLTWLWYQLSRHTEVEERLRAEVETVLGGRPVTIDDLPRLSYTRQVIQEALRLYPQPPINMRRAVGDDEIGGYPIPAGTRVMFSVYHLHRHPEFWDNPKEFDPDRFDEQAVAGRDRSCYIPFGIGSRICVGNTFAMTEMQIALVTLLQRFRLVIPPKPVGYRVLLTLDTGHPVMARLRPASTEL